MKRLLFLVHTYYDEYKSRLSFDLNRHLKFVKPINLTADMFGSSFIQSAVASSSIEGNPLDLNSYMRAKTTDKITRNKSFLEIECLISAYELARMNRLSLDMLLEAHRTLSRPLLQEKSDMGKFRRINVVVASNVEGVIYSAVDHSRVNTEMQKLFSDLEHLLYKKLSTTETFYYASLLHLKFVNIHPFVDGNGRSARLLEKWFLAEKLGERAWHIKSEVYYEEQLKKYYKYLKLGRTYDTINYGKSIPFLLLLPQALKLK